MQPGHRRLQLFDGSTKSQNGRATRWLFLASVWWRSTRKEVAELENCELLLRAGQVAPVEVPNERIGQAADRSQELVEGGSAEDMLDLPEGARDRNARSRRPGSWNHP